MANRLIQPTFGPSVLAPLLVAVLGACAPTTGSVAPKTLLVPGGTIAGRWANLESQTFPLPSPPRFADTDGNTLYAAYGYELLVFRDGALWQSLPLPSPPRFLHARPQPVVGVREGVYLPGKGLFPYPALDARLKGALWWTDGDAWREGDRLASGPFRLVVADDERVAFLGGEAFFPGLSRFPLPKFRAAELYQNLYLLTDQGVLAFSPGGVLLGKHPGIYDALAVDGRGVWLLQNQGGLLRLSLDLEEAP
jgi:hypothetical protein